MDNSLNTQTENIHWGHFAVILSSLVLLVGVTWLSKPELFNFKKSPTASSANVPHYYAYQDTTSNQPQVLGASTNEGPQIINEDGSISPVDMGQVLGASTQDVQLSLDDISVKVIPDSSNSVQKYFSDDKAIEVSPVDDADFEAALTSGDQSQINAQAQKLIGVRDALQKLSVPEGLVKLDKLKIIQYNAAISILQNFTQADNDPQLVGDNLQQFLKSQQDLDDEIAAVAQKYNLTPEAIGATGDIAAIEGAQQGLQSASSAISDNQNPLPTDQLTNNLSDGQ